MYIIFPTIDKNGNKYKYIPNIVLKRLEVLGYDTNNIFGQYYRTSFTIKRMSNNMFEPKIRFTSDPYLKHVDHELGDFLLLFTTDIYNRTKEN